MSTFADNTGHTWRVAINLGAVSRIRQKTSINLHDATLGESSRRNPVNRIVSNRDKLIAVLYVACESQADKLGLSQDDFAARFDDATVERAREALGAEVIDYFPVRSAPTLRTLFRIPPRSNAVAV